MIGRSWAPRARVGAVVAMAMMGAMNVGCGGDFVAPPPGAGDTVGSRDAAPKPGAGTTVSAGPVGRIDFIASRRMDPDEQAVQSASARTQAGLDKARLHIWPDDDTIGSPDASAIRNKTQAELLRASIAQKPAAILVDADDPADKELARAVREARSARVPVIVVGRPIADAGGPKAAGMAPMIVVAPPPFIDSARRIVELSLRNLKNDKVDASGRAIILVTDPADRLADDRAGAIRQALADAKITAVSELRIPKDLERASALLKARLEGDPKIALVFFTDQNGSTVATHVAEEISEKRPYVQAGYTADESRARLVRFGNYAAVGEFDPNRLLRRAITVAVNVARGREARDREEFPINLVESPASSGVAHIAPLRSAMPGPAPEEKKGH